MNQRIVIIGGMGPQASLELHRKVLVEAVRKGARDGNDFPEIVHLSLPIKDFISSREAVHQALAQMAEAARSLYLWRPRQAGCSL